MIHIMALEWLPGRALPPSTIIIIILVSFVLIFILLPSVPLDVRLTAPLFE